MNVIGKEIKKCRVLLTSVDYLFAEYFLLNKTQLKEACTVTLGSLVNELHNLDEYFPKLIEKIRNHNVNHKDEVLNYEIEKTLSSINTVRKNIRDYRESINSDVVWYNNHKNNLHDVDIRRLENELNLVNGFEVRLNNFYNSLNDFIN